MKTRSALFWAGAAALLGVMGSAALAQSDQDGGLWLPYGASSDSAEIDFMYKAIFWVTTGMFILVEGLILVFCVIYRRRPGHRPHYTHGNNVAEIIWTVVPALMLLGLALWQIPIWHKIKRDGFPKPGDPDTTYVQVIGEQFKWNFRYPDSKKKVEDAENDLTNMAGIHVPLGNTVLIHTRSKDVIHSFFVPHMRVKQDAVPGLRQRIWFKPNRFLLIDLKKPLKKEGTLQNKEWKLVDRMVLETEWVHDAKEFETGGKYFDKRIAVSTMEDYAEIDGLYQPFKLPDGTLKQVRVLHQGKVLPQKQPWESCQYALGIFEIACAELCGLGHATMRAFLVVEPKASYDDWFKRETVDAAEPRWVWKHWKD